MEKRLIVLGFLLRGPLSGYRIHKIAAGHADIYGALKRANVYYLLGRLGEQGLVRHEGTAHVITAAGRREFDRLLRAELRADAPRLGVEAAAILMRYARPSLARELLTRRQAALAERRARASRELSLAAGGPADLLVALCDAELGWLDRALLRLT